MSSFGRDDLSHLSMSPHMELSRMYGTSRTACFIWRHTSSIALRSGQPGDGQPRGGICESFPGVCRTAAPGLRWRFRVFLPPAAQGGSAKTRMAMGDLFWSHPSTVLRAAVLAGTRGCSKRA